MSNSDQASTLPRCPWAGDDALYRHYHDSEWGRPVVSDTRLFEKICLEGFQSGLSWITILRKRGFKFVGPATCYAFMQAMGLVNDHTAGCFCREDVEIERNALVRPLPAR
ncbi:MAG: DNA-3-methyladenine glycosylase I [Candidatus Devosia euplotis]|nr:DNA-3-methyladenine glycosylase I [Candidatus Devosia euplotis]